MSVKTVRTSCQAENGTEKAAVAMKTSESLLSQLTGVPDMSTLELAFEVLVAIGVMTIGVSFFFL